MSKQYREEQHSMPDYPTYKIPFLVGTETKDLIDISYEQMSKILWEQSEAFED